MKVTKAIILAGGFGTRRLPITKAIDKCMLPIGDRPIIQYGIDDCVNAGITDIYIGLSALGDQIKVYLGHNQKLEDYVRHKNGNQLALLAPETRARIHYFDSQCYTDQPQGTAMPIARFYNNFGMADNELIAVVSGDEFVYKPHGGSAIGQLITATLKAGATAGLLGYEVPYEETHKYGVIQVDRGNFVQIIEKPAPGTAPTNLINISKYVFDKQMVLKAVDVCRTTNGNKEAYVTDALNAYVATGKMVHVAKATGTYLDGGTLQGWLHANTVVTAE